MADEQEGQLSATFPDPPPFYKNFTPKNLSRLNEAKESAGISEPSSGQAENSAADRFARLRLLELPPEVRTLIPPELPKDGKYRTFGDTYDIHESLAPLSSMGVEQLYPSEPSPDTGSSTAQTSSRAHTLKLLARSILLNYLELVGILSLDPEKYQSKIEDLSTIFINAHHLINEYRPHQARETLILTMEEQVERKKAEIEGVKKMREKVESVLKDLGKETEGREANGLDTRKTSETTGQGISKSPEKAISVEESRDIWEALDGITSK